MRLNNERGNSIIWFIAFMLLSGLIGILISRMNLRTAVTEETLTRKTTNTIANTFDVTEGTDVAIGDNVYHITPVETLDEQVYPANATLEFGKDKITFTMSTKYDWVNYAILNEEDLIDYKLDPKTVIVGIPFSDFTSPTSSVTVKDYDYPNLLNLVPYTSNYSKNRLSFDVKDGKYKLKFPYTYLASNDINEQSESTTFTVELPKKFTDVVVFYSDLTHLPPTVLNDDSDEVLSYLNNIPYIRLNYNDSEKLIALSTNLVSVDNKSINNKLSYSGTTFQIDMYENDAYEIISEGSKLNYPSQNKFVYQIYKEVEVSNWNLYSNAYNIEFRNCLPRTINIGFNKYYHTINKTNTVAPKN